MFHTFQNLTRVPEMLFQLQILRIIDVKCFSERYFLQCPPRILMPLDMVFLAVSLNVNKLLFFSYQKKVIKVWYTVCNQMKEMEGRWYAYAQTKIKDKP